ncbi:MAG TPA: glutamine-hydrolyzing carbamoyl-phosphate synthase small subunit [Xanthomonadales bacterium]|nr:glutamine-hydrolyzing carbamoyl-phosphate synthase small subunit [Xanthomonadales bacterium]
MSELAILALEDGTVFHGQGIGAGGESCGEVVFNTAMTGYQEILTDPSYNRQIVTLTHPHIGNTGCNEQDNESERVMAAGLVIRDCPVRPSNWRLGEALPDFLKRQGIVAISGIDTRKLTRILREKGALSGAIVSAAAFSDVNIETAIALAQSFPGMKGLDLAREVTTRQNYEWRAGSWSLDEQHWANTPARRHVVAYDFGIKRNILRMLADRGCHVTVVPATTSAEAVLDLAPDGVFLSNGPGDPEPCDYAIKAIRSLLKRKVPLFGICLGHQLLGLAAGARTSKMKFGHHGANHPVQDLDTGCVLITSQNHGFAVDESSLPPTVRATHRSLFDQSLQGIEFNNAPAFGFQGHPEASPGPHDMAGLFDRFIRSIDAARAGANVTVLREVR